MTDYSYTTVALVESELRATTPASETTSPTLADIEQWIKDASADVNRVAARTYGETAYTEVFDYNGTDVLVLRNAPLISVESVKYSIAQLGSTEYSLTTVKTEDTDFTVFNEEGEIEFLSNWRPQNGLKRIQVDYTAGYATIPTDIQALTTKKVAKRVIDTLMAKDINEKKSGKSVSVGSISIVKPADFGVSQYKALGMDIATMEQSVIGGTSVYRIPLNRY